MADKDFVVKNGLVVANGNISVTGTVDGRDVATDGTKLDGIESGATADQTASEILTAIKTVDGAESGLDADLLDGQEGTYYLDWTNTTNKPDPVITLAGDLSGSVTLTDLTSGTLTATVETLNQNTTGNASTATTLQTPITINGVSFDGSDNITVTATTTNALTIGSYLTGSSYNGSSAITIAADATSSNTASKLVARDASGNFSAGDITASGLTIGAITLPATDGTNGQVLTTNGAGVVTFADAGGGGGTSTFLGLTDTPSSYSGASNQLVGVNAAENALGFVDEIEISEFVLSAVTAPTTPAADSMAMYVTASGTTPNREVSYKMKNELGQEIIISSILV